MNKVYYLKTCNTCIRIINDLNISNTFELQDIKSDPITVSQIEDMKRLAGNYEALFSKRAKLYREMGLKEQPLKEKDYKHYILEHYTFLKRPVIIINDEIFVGNSQKNIKAAKNAIENL